MKAPTFDISYAAHTASCTFLLDAEGICRRIVMAPSGKRRESSRTAVKCVGAQYVASLDGSAAGGLVEMPRVGAAMLFARADEHGRISLVRTGALTSFESKVAADRSLDPFADSCSVETSAPDLDTPAVGRPSHGDLLEPDYYDPSDRTQRIHALRPDEIAAALREPSSELATSEYHPASRGPTLRSPHRDATLEGDDDDSRGMLPRRSSDPRLRAVRSSAARSRDATARRLAPEPAQTPRAQASDIRVSSRRR